MGVIEPYVKLVSFWNGNRPVLTLTFYATHSEAYYNLRAIDTGFVGLARGMLDTAHPGEHTSTSTGPEPTLGPASTTTGPRKCRQL